MQSTGPRPPILHDSAGRAATCWAVVIWSLVFYLSALGNVWTAWLAARRDGQPIVVWQVLSWVLSWELSSATAALLLLLAVVWLCARWPLHADVWVRRLPAYVTAALGWWLLHVAGMVVLRMLVYALAGAHYDFGGWLQWFYELSKDLRTFALPSRPIPATRACICAMPACCRAVAATWPVCVPMQSSAAAPRPDALVA